MYTEESDLFLILFQESGLFSNTQLLKIYREFKDFKIAFNSSLENYIKDIKKLTQLRNFIQNKNRATERIREINDSLIINEIQFLSYSNPNYPETLKNLSNPPIGLFIKGELNLKDLEKSISIIGTRNPSYYGHTKARSIAKELAMEGYIIISGLARGIDLEAHIGALEGEGRTIAVLGSSIDNIYPSEHRNIANDIISNGAIISESLGDSPMKKYQLANRNRIIAGLSQASLIIEGSLNSGTRYEVDYARKLNKSIFTLIPKNPEREISQLPLSLIEQGHIPINTTRDILNHREKTKRQDLTSFM